MSFQRIPLLAGVPHTLEIPGKLLLIDSPGVAGAVDVALVSNGTPRAAMVARRAGFRHIGAFDGVVLTSAIATTVTLFLSFEDVNLGTNQLEITNPETNPVKVTFSQQIVPLGSVTVNNADAQAVPIVQKAGTVFDTRPYLAATLTNVAPVAVTDVVSPLLAAAVGRRGFRAKNVGGNPVALVGAGGTFAAAVMVIQPGETWNENEAPGAAWYCLCEAGLVSNINLLTIA